MPNPSAQLVNHFHSRITIECSTPNLGVPQQTTTNMYGQGYTHTTHSFTNPNPDSAPYTSRYNSQAYPNPRCTYQAPYTTIACTDPIPLPSNSLGFLSNHAYQTLSHFNAYGQPETDDFGYEIPLQFPFRPQLIDMTLARATAEPDVDPNNLTNQLAVIL
jgi:hypothetical protein